MHTLLSLLVVVVVVVVGDPLYVPTGPYHGDGSRVPWWPYKRPSRDPRPAHLPFYHPGDQGYTKGDAYPGGGSDLLVQLGDHGDSSSVAMSLDEPNVMDIQKQYPKDLLLPHRLMENQGYPLSFPNRPFPWFFPAPPGYPTRPEGIPQLGDVDCDDIFGSRPAGGSLLPNPWHDLKPYIPQRPDADDLPDNYKNTTHKVLEVDGKRVEVNTTTNKRTDGSFTSFVHTQVIHVLPDNYPKEVPEEEEDNTPKETPKEGELTPTEAPKVEEHTPKETPSDEEVTMNPVATEEGMPTEGEVVSEKPTEEPPVEDVTKIELPTFNHAVPAELVQAPANDDTQAVSAIDNQLTRDNREATKPEKQLPYRKYPGGSKSKSKGKGKIEGQLSGDTLVNETGRKPEDPDAEKINEELL